jgi:hypothetical protein
MDALNNAIILNDTEQFEKLLPKKFGDFGDDVPPLITAMFERRIQFLRPILERTDWTERVKKVPLFYVVLRAAITGNCLDVLTIILDILKERGELQNLLDLGISLFLIQLLEFPVAKKVLKLVTGYDDNATSFVRELVATF